MAANTDSGSAQRMSLAEMRRCFQAARAELATVVAGHDTAIEHLLVAMFADGHVILTGVPGLGRTLLVKTLATVLGLDFRRIQFTPDLLPTDITGTEVLIQVSNVECRVSNEKESAAFDTRHSTLDTRAREFRFFPGPVFANLVLADEVNRSPPRTQAALLEVMQERQVTVGGRKHPAPRPFLLVATQNSLETDGVYPLPEAQMDRFMLSIHLAYPSPEEEVRIIESATGVHRPTPRAALTPEQLIEFQRLARLVPVAPSVKRYALALVRNTRPGMPGAPLDVDRLVRWGASPRAGQALIAGAKVLAAVRGRPFATRGDVRQMALPVLAHRLIPSFRAGAEGVSIRDLVARLVAATDAQFSPAVNDRRWRDILVR